MAKENANDKLRKWLEDDNESKTYSICCKRCGKYIGESKSNDNGSVMCLDCYHNN